MQNYLSDSRKFRVSHRNKFSRGGLKELQQIWKNQEVDEYYQSIIQEYLQYFNSNQLEQETQREKQLTFTRRSFFFTLQQLQTRRFNILNQLKTEINELESLEYKTQKSFENICRIIDQLRAINLSYAEELLNIHQYYSQKISEKPQYRALGSLFQSLNEDNSFLKSSIMRKFIIFSQSYDPFFLKHYELLKTTNNQRLKQLKCIEDLFDIPINLVYRITKAQQTIKQYLNFSQNINEQKTAQIKKREIISPILTNSPQIRKRGYSQRVQPRNARLMNEIYLQKNRQNAFQPEYAISQKVRKQSNDSEFGFLSQDRQNGIGDRRNKMFLLPKLITTINTDKNQNYRERSSKLRPNYQQEQNGKSSSSSIRKKNFNPDKSLALVQERQKQFKSSILPRKYFSKNINEPRNSQNGRQNIRKSQSTITREKQTLQSIKRSQKSERQTRNIFDTHQNNAYSKGKDISIQCEDITLNPNGIETISKSQIKNNQKNRQKQIATQVEPKIEEQSQEQSIVQQPTKQLLKKNNSSSPTKILNKEAAKQTNQYQQQPKQSSEKQLSNKSPIKTKQSSKPKNRYKNFKLKASPISISKIFDVLKQMKIKQLYRKTYEVSNWENSIAHNQYYFHKFFIDEELQAISLCCGLPQGDILIKYWGPMESCDDQMSNFLFGKFLQHIEKQTLCKSIYYNASQINELRNNNFTKKKERIFQRDRINASNCPIDYFYPFLSINFNNIAINKLTPNQQDLVIKDSDIKQFQTHRFICFNYLLIINKLMSPGSFANVATYSPNLKGITNVNQKILEEQFSQIPYNPEFKCNYAHFLTLKIRNPIFSAFFIADKGFIKLIGDLIYEGQEDQIIISLQLLKFNTKFYFAKGFKTVAEIAEKIKINSKITITDKKNKIQFSVRMFRKQLRGKMLSINLKQENCFADFQIRFEWRDYLTGKIEHPMTDCQIFDQHFMCLLQMQRQTMFAFEIQPKDFLPLS